MIDSLVDRIEALLSYGWRQVLIVTDHGWLLLPNGFPKVELPQHLTSLLKGRCAVLKDGKVLAHYRKRLLPNYAVFDEERYFTAGKDAAVFKLNGVRIGLNICEDVWNPGPVGASRSAGAEVMRRTASSTLITPSSRT